MYEIGVLVHMLCVLYKYIKCNSNTQRTKHFEGHKKLRQSGN
jgi:hypothetical protein